MQRNRDSENWPEEWCKSILVAIPKKGDLAECSNYRMIALIPHACKVMLNIILHRVKGVITENLSEEQGGFRTNYSTVQQILILRLLAEVRLAKNKNLYLCFVDFKKAFDSVWHNGLWASLKAIGMSGKLVRI